MKKLGKRFLIFVGFIGLLYLLYMFFVMPNGYTDKEVLVEDFIAGIGQSDSCETYFNEDTIGVCESFESQLDGKEVSVTDLNQVSSEVEVTLNVDGTDIPFTFYFQANDPGGIRGIFNDAYYLIDSIR
jgi:hypothetical protein